MSTRSNRPTATGAGRPSVPAILAVVAACVALAALPPEVTASFDEQVTVDSRILTLANLIGEVTVEGHAGTSFELEVHVRGEDGTPDKVKIEVESGERGVVYIAYPVERQTRFVYPELGRNSRSEFKLDDGDESLLEERLARQGARRIRVSGGGRGHEVWADVTVRVPAGREVRIELGVGQIDVHDVASVVRAQAWSGHVNAARVDGDLMIDTGSGHVEVAGVRGAVDIDTGSGHVTMSDCDGPDIRIDSGSGHVDIDGARCGTLDVDTGSGHVEALAVRAERAKIDTGSGRVALALERMGDGPFVIDTGSGAVDLRLPADASAQIDAETGSGRIRVDRRDAYLTHKDEGEITLEIGDGAARVRIDTGSGGISIGTI